MPPPPPPSPHPPASLHAACMLRHVLCGVRNASRLSNTDPQAESLMRTLRAVSHAGLEGHVCISKGQRQEEGDGGGQDRTSNKRILRAFMRVWRRVRCRASSVSPGPPPPPRPPSLPPLRPLCLHHGKCTTLIRYYIVLHRAEKVFSKAGGSPATV